MKNICALFGIFTLLLFSSNTLLAVKPVKNTPSAQEVSKELTEKETKKLQKLEKRMNKRMEKMNAKANAGIDFDDPVDKWMWFWIFAWGLGLGVAFVYLCPTFRIKLRRRIIFLKSGNNVFP